MRTTIQKRFAFILLLLPAFLLAQPPVGYYNAAVGKTEAALKTALSSIISAGTVDVGYDGLYNVYKTSDNLPSGKVWDMYSIKADGTANYYFTHSTDKCGSYSAEGNCYNREHTFCDSWLGAASPQRSDAHHILPTDGYVNNRRSSYPHGKVGSVSWTSSNGSKLGTSDASTGYSGTVFEPIDEFKGDFARMYFYVATRYESKIAGWAGNGSAAEILSGNTYPAFKTWFYTLLLQWNAQDPVSQKEINRNNAIAVYQKNRNPYIDYPDLANYIWGAKKGQAWNTSTGTSPSLTNPGSGVTIDFGKIVYQQTAGTDLQISAANLTGDLTLALSGTNASNFSLSTTSLTKAQAEAGYALTVNYSASTIGSHTATLTISGGGITAVTVALKAISSNEFLAMPATNISTTGFNANWTNSYAATGYALNVYSMVNAGGTQSQTLINEEFNAGLPTGWTSAGFTENVPVGSMRMGSGSQIGKIITPAVNLSAKTSTLLVRAKQYSNDAGAQLTATLDDQPLTVWTTGVDNQDFSIVVPKATSASKIALSVVAGKRVFVDYVNLATEGAISTPVSVAGYPRSVGNVLTYIVDGLQVDSAYFYTVTPEGNGNAISNQIAVRTLLSDAVNKVPYNTIIWVVQAGGIQLKNLVTGTKIDVFDGMGRKINVVNTTTTSDFIALPQHGIYILKVGTKNQQTALKVVY